MSHDDEMDDQRLEAVEIAVAAGALKRCEFHDEAYDHGGDREAAYRVASARYRDDELRCHYSSRLELTDAVKEAIESAPDSCWLCDKHFYED